MEELKKFKRRIKINVRFSDLDAMQHVNNAKYLSYLEEARLDYFNTLFNRDKSRLDFEAVVGKIDINYHYPILLGDEVEVLTRISKIGNKSVDVDHVIRINKGNEFIKSATAFTKLVFYDYKTQTTKIIPEAIKKIIANFEEIDY